MNLHCSVFQQSSDKRLELQLSVGQMIHVGGSKRSHLFFCVALFKARLESHPLHLWRDFFGLHCDLVHLHYSFVKFKKWKPAKTWRQQKWTSCCLTSSLVADTFRPEIALKDAAACAFKITFAPPPEPCTGSKLVVFFKGQHPVSRFLKFHIIRVKVRWWFHQFEMACFRFYVLKVRLLLREN